MALWAISKSPLIINADIQKLSLRSQNVLKMQNLIDINQNAKHQAKCIKYCNFKQYNYNYSVFMTDFKNKTKVIAIINWVYPKRNIIVTDLHLMECDAYKEIWHKQKHKEVKTIFKVEIKDLFTNLVKYDYNEDDIAKPELIIGAKDGGIYIKIAWTGHAGSQ